MSEDEQMTEDEMLNAAIEAEIDAALAAEVEARRAKMRDDIAARLRREASNRHYDRINARHPIEGPLGGLTVEQEAERQRQMDERRRLAGERMDRANSAPVAGQVARSLRPKRSDGAGGAVGFSIKS
jgi:hypothetical protein